MIETEGGGFLQVIDGFDCSISKRWNKACDWKVVLRGLGWASRLGNGVFWYVLMGCLPVFYGLEGLQLAGKMLLAGASGVFLYRLLKGKTSRPRPYKRFEEIRLGAEPLDQFSFPSGHTLHAVCFTILAGAAFPMLLWLLVPFTVLVALSRVVLGLHYPTDVLAGAVVGAGLAALWEAL